MKLTINLKRAISQLVAQARGVSEPDEVDERREMAVRDMASKVGAYAEKGSTFDPAGKYLCGTCCFRDGENGCTIVSGKISMVIGSCFLYYRGEPVELNVAEKFSQKEAMYSERPEAKGFGCSRCKFGGEAKNADSQGRKSWCSFWGMHIEPKACCISETGKDLVEAPGE